MNTTNIKGLTDINNELIRQLETKKDYIVDTSNIITHYDQDTNLITIELSDINQSFELTDNCHSQLGTKLKIPNKYYQYLKDNYPELLTKNINTLIPDQHSSRMIRTLDNKARAFLSDRYKAIDNIDVFSKTLHELNDIRTQQNVEIIGSNLTDNNLYIKAISKDLTDTINPDTTNKKKGDIVHGGIIISNSETGHGSYKVMPFIHVVVCNNGMISDKIFRRVHLGKKQEEQTINWSEQTSNLENQLLWSKLTDMIHNTFNKETFQTWIDEINQVAHEHIPKPTIAVNKLVSLFPEINKDDTDTILEQFAEYGYNKWGLTQAVTRTAQNKEDYEKQIKYEQLAPKILDLEIKQLQ
jgi:hypothetical protein